MWCSKKVRESGLAECRGEKKEVYVVERVKSMFAESHQEQVPVKEYIPDGTSQKPFAELKKNKKE